VLTYCAAAARGLPILVDAEQSWFQSWIDYAALLMSVRYNRTRPVVYNTYQLYLADTLQRMRADLGMLLHLWLLFSFVGPWGGVSPHEYLNCTDCSSDRAGLKGYFLGAKLVRGAYLVSETARAVSLGYSSPTCASKEVGEAAVRLSRLAGHGPQLRCGCGTVSRASAARRPDDRHTQPR
jgi:proline dehydrogenase